MTLGMSLPLYSTKTALRFLRAHLSSSFFSVVILLNLSPQNVALWARPYSTLSAHLVSKTVISPGSPGFYSYCSSPPFSASFPSSFSIAHTLQLWFSSAYSLSSSHSILHHFPVKPVFCYGLNTNGLQVPSSAPVPFLCKCLPLGNTQPWEN